MPNPIPLCLTYFTHFVLDVSFCSSWNQTPGFNCMDTDTPAHTPPPSWPPDLIKSRYKCTLLHPSLHLDCGENLHSNGQKLVIQKLTCSGPQKTWDNCGWTPLISASAISVEFRRSGRQSATFISPVFFLFFRWKLIRFAVLWCYRGLATHRTSPKQLLTVSAAGLSQRLVPWLFYGSMKSIHHCS